MRRLIAASAGQVLDGSSRRADPSAAVCRLLRSPKAFVTFRWSSGLARRSGQETTTAAGRSPQSGAPLGRHDSRKGAGPGLTGEHKAQQHSLALRVLHVINDSTKWTVTATAAATLFCFPSAEVLWCITGSVAAAVVCKVLKVVINQSRPAGARSADPGMPSSHANSLGYFGSYVALSALASPPVKWTALLRAAAAMTATVILASLRVALGYHNTSQVVAGLTLGCLLAASWRMVFCSYIGTSAITDAAYERLYGVTAVAACLFGFAFIRRWFVAFRVSRT